MELPKQAWLKPIVVIFYVLLAGLLTVGIIFLGYRLLLPFAAAWLFALFMQKLCELAAGHTKMGRKMLSYFLTFFVLFALSALFYLLMGKLLSELRGFLSGLGAYVADLPNVLSKAGEDLTRRLPQERQREAAKSVEKLISEVLARLGDRLTGFLTGLAGAWAKKMPDALLSVLLFFLSCFYLTADFHKVNAYISSLFPEKVRKKTAGSLTTLRTLLGKYLKAYGVLLLITFGEMWLGLLLCGQRYALFPALLIAILDFLPAIGVGTVLVPWAIVAFLLGNTGMGIRLLILFAVSTVARQVIEPHIVGKEFGIHPFAALVFLYVGFKTLGVLGMLLSPFFAIGAKALSETLRERFR